MLILDRLGDYVLERELGRGGMGVVYLARQESLGRLVALKVLPFELTRDSNRLHRFQREAEVISRLDHPSIIPLYGVGETEGIHYIAMKYVQGETLDKIIRSKLPPDDAEEQEDDSSDALSSTQVLSPTERGCTPGSQLGGAATGGYVIPEPEDDPGGDAPIPCEESDVGWTFICLRLAERLARALHHAHVRGVIHRDVKPSNVIIDKGGHPYLLDFGLVRDTAAGDQTLTATGGMLGTAYYMAPELVRSDHRRCDHRVDVYSLGVTLYEMVTLRRPFPYKSPDVLFHAIVKDDPVPPRKIDPRLPRDLETVILKAMDKDPARRYRTAEELAEDLRRVRSFEPIEARPVGVFGRARRWVHRNPVLAGSVLFGLLSFVGMLEYGIYRDLLERRRASEALGRADSAYDSGDDLEAMAQYRLYLALGGDSQTIAPRFQALLRRRRAAPDPAHAGSGR